MARIVGGIATSHLGALGVAIDKGLTRDPSWASIFEAYGRTRQWMADTAPDVIIVVYNDHAASFSTELIPTFAIGCAAEYRSADEGWGPRSIPLVEGDPEFSGHIAQELILNEFDMTIVSRLDLDHGCTVPLSLMFGERASYPARIIPIAVNVIQYPPPTGLRCLKLGRALRKAIESFPKDLKVQVWGTGGMSHQLQGPRAGLINREFDQAFLEKMKDDFEELADISHARYFEEAGTEGVELIMWLVMRGALTPKVKELHRFYHVPASNTALGHLVYEDA